MCTLRPACFICFDLPWNLQQCLQQRSNVWSLQQLLMRTSLTPLLMVTNPCNFAHPSTPCIPLAEQLMTIVRQAQTTNAVLAGWARERLTLAELPAATHIVADSPIHVVPGTPPVPAPKTPQCARRCNSPNYNDFAKGILSPPSPYSGSTGEVSLPPSPFGTPPAEDVEHWPDI